MKNEKNIKHKPRLRLRIAETTITDVITILAGFFLVWSLFSISARSTAFFVMHCRLLFFVSFFLATKRSISKVI